MIYSLKQNIRLNYGWKSTRETRDWTRARHTMTLRANILIDNHLEEAEEIIEWFLRGCRWRKNLLYALNKSMKMLHFIADRLNMQ